MNKLIFYEVDSKKGNMIKGKRRYLFIKGKKAEKEGYYYPHLDINRFADEPIKIPKNAKKARKPSLKWIRSFMYDPKKIHAVKKYLKKHENDKIYKIHDNGGVPFIVYITSSLVSVFRIPKNTYIWQTNWSSNFIDNIPYYTELVVQFKDPLQIFIGDNKRNNDGNSLLIQISPRKYVFIGESIYSFLTMDKIHTFFSQIGNSDVPYPVAESDKNVYFMLDKVILDKNTFPKLDNYFDAYRNFYDLPKNTKKQKFCNLKIIQKRII